MSWILSDHLKPELFKPYRTLWITSICPCSPSNSEPATTYSYSFVVASRYAWGTNICPPPPPTFMLYNLARNIDSLRLLLKLLQNRCCLLDQELGDHPILIWLYDVHYVCMQKQVYLVFLVFLRCICNPF